VIRENRTGNAQEGHTMDLAALREFLFWWLVVNVGIYLVTAGGTMMARDRIARLHVKLFGVEEATARKAMYGYVAAYKLLITVFAFAPWLALVILG